MSGVTVAISGRLTGQRTKTTKGPGSEARMPAVLRPARVTGVFPRTVRSPTAVEERLDADASIEPCLVGWSENAEDGVEIYCCEQPGGGMECRTVTSEHTECVVVEGDDGTMMLSCDEGDVKAAKEAEDAKKV
eukprot:CAMPEP_0181364570 /NCGR_PEP_ID=MMETSP1106-20121128/9488_1 /TAXON_ID=81844 /ORGANISM="Mantoniella antarctica, Strain SL-175" /LENGTH=132 /DNA_ID=CAMNT_0023479355 /DNA_START=206 /DNA_END=604 /DNA_ORIENTATION=+